MKEWNDPELQAFMRAVSAGGLGTQESSKHYEEKGRNIPKEDLTVDGYINKYGGIQSTIDGSIHTNKNSYKEHLKQNNCTIKDW